MVYRVIGLMSGSSLDGLDMVFTTISETSGLWEYKIEQASCIAYEPEWSNRLKNATSLPSRDYMQLHSDYGQYTGRLVNEFIETHHLHHQVALIASHGHTTFHDPAHLFTHQLGDGAAIAAVTGLPVVSDLRNMDVALRGQGAPIVPLGEQLLFPNQKFFLNIGGIANISVHDGEKVIAFDVCPANRLLNLLAAEKNMEYDNGGKMAASGTIDPGLFHALNELDYYQKPFPKSLSNEFGTEVVRGILRQFKLSTEDKLATYTEHIAIQLRDALQPFRMARKKMLCTGGGAFNNFLMERIQFLCREIIETQLPSADVIQYKEALIMGLLGALRWREQNTVLASVTGASRDSTGGALWMGR